MGRALDVLEQTIGESRGEIFRKYWLYHHYSEKPVPPSLTVGIER